MPAPSRPAQRTASPSAWLVSLFVSHVSAVVLDGIAQGRFQRLAAFLGPALVHIYQILRRRLGAQPPEALDDGELGLFVHLAFRAKQYLVRAAGDHLQLQPL